MELVPPWATLALSSITFIVLIILLVIGFSTKRNRAASKLGQMMAARNLRESMTRSLPVALLCAIMIASLSVGDGLLLMVEQNTDENLSSVDLVIDIPEYTATDVISRSLTAGEDHVNQFEAMVHLDGIAEKASGGSREGVKVIGALDPENNMLGIESVGGGAPEPLIARTDSYINSELAEKLGVTTGEELLVSVYDIGSEQDNLLGYSSSAYPQISIRIVDIIANKGIGRYREDALGKMEPIVVMKYSYLTERLDKVDLVNKVLINVDNEKVDEASVLIKNNFDEILSIEDAGFKVQQKDDRIILTHEDFFFHPQEVGLEPDAGTLSYFVDSISTDHSGLSHSVITGITESDLQSNHMTLLRWPFERGTIYVNNWTMDRMNLTIGESIRIDYRRVTELGTLEEDYRFFTIAGVAYLNLGLGWDGWIPDIPGVTEAPSCGDWDPSFDIDIDSLTGDDYEYWNLYHTIPKAFIHVEDAREMWGIPSGNTTMVLFDQGNFSDQDLLNWSVELSEHVTLSSIRGSIRNVREDALASSRAMLIFPGMFLTFGSIIMIGALLVLYALFKDLAGKRAHEWGILRSIGVGKRNLLVAGSFEAFWPILFGIALGLVFGFIIGSLLNIGLDSAWSNSVENASIPFAIGGGTISLSIAITVLLSFIIAMFSLMREVRGAPISNIRDIDPTVTSSTKWMRIRMIAAGLILFIGGLFVLLPGAQKTGMTSAGLFVFGSIMASSGIGLLGYQLVSRLRSGSDVQLMVTSNLARRPGKNPLSIAILSLMLTLAISLTMMGSMLEEDVSSSYESYGGGYDWVVETSVPFRGDLDELPLPTIPFLSVGEEGGTCSNINAPFPPRLLGVMEGFETASEFDLIEHDSRYQSEMFTWNGLRDRVDGKIPILVDQNTLQWIYYEDLRSEFQITSENGEELTLLVVGILGPSVLTGTFVMSWDILKEEFTSRAKPTFFLVRGYDGPDEKDLLAEGFNDAFPTITSVEDLASENLDFELSYLYLFRDFLVFGLIVAMSSAAVFTHVRAISLKKEMATLRSIGVTKKRSARYFLTENMIVFSISTLAAVIGSFISVMVFGPLLGGLVPSISTLGPSSVVAVVFLLVAVIISAGSALWALKDFSKLTVRN